MGNFQINPVMIIGHAVMQFTERTFINQIRTDAVVLFFHHRLGIRMFHVMPEKSPQNGDLVLRSLPDGKIHSLLKRLFIDFFFQCTGHAKSSGVAIVYACQKNLCHIINSVPCILCHFRSCFLV